MTETTVNVPLLRKVLEHVTEHPEEWNQGEWAMRTDCGTTYCIAGHAVVMAGEEIDWSSANASWATSGAVAGGQLIPRAAADLLGIEYHRDDEEVGTGHLFSLGNGLRDVWTIASELTGGEIEVPAEIPGGGGPR